MRKSILSICLFFIVIATSAQLTPSVGGISYTPISGIDYVFMFNGITSATEIAYTGPINLNTTISWSKFSNGSIRPYSSDQASILLDDTTGYILDVDGKKTKIWVIDYNKILPRLNNISIAPTQSNECKSVDLLIDATVPALTYQTPDGMTLPISRDFNISYTTLSWKGTAWQDSTVNKPITLPGTPKITVPVPAPYRNTTFTLTGDQYAKDLGIDLAVISSDYTPAAVICHETSVIPIRTATNEDRRPVDAAQVSGSAPLDIQFFANANEPITHFFNWEIFKDNAKTSLISNRHDNLTPYTFSEAGVYKVVVTASNDNPCSYSDTITVTVSESSIQVPNVFTPNGDGTNDEFRIAYKSILSFHCWVYNRWGRLVYEWTDPTKGWDGNINGKEASPGAYFYIINAIGSDAKKYKLKGDINLLR